MAGKRRVSASALPPELWLYIRGMRYPLANVCDMQDKVILTPDDPLNERELRPFLKVHGLL